MNVLKQQNQNTIRVLIADSHALVRAGLEALIQEIDKQAIIMQASNGTEALNYLYENTGFDLILMDIVLPDMDGLEVLKKLRQKSSDETIIIVISSVQKPSISKQTESLGAKLFLAKDTPSTTIVQYIRSALKKTSLPLEESNNVEPFKKKLNKRQLQIVQYMSQGMSNKEISQTIFLSEGTIKNHITQIFSFLGVSNRTQAIIEAEKLNLIKSNPTGSKFS